VTKQVSKVNPKQPVFVCYPDMPVCNGPFNLSCTTNKEPAAMIKEMTKALD
jgi:hypothetical protein